jgi:hypothetical protein
MSDFPTVSNVAASLQRATKLVTSVEYPGFIDIAAPSDDVYLLGNLNDTWMADHYPTRQEQLDGSQPVDSFDALIPGASEDAQGIADAFLTHLLAIEFGRVLRQWIPENMAEVITKNKRYRGAGDLGVCASHDYCDANMAMSEASDNLGLTNPSELTDSPEQQKLFALWGAAWSLAKAGNFEIK